MNQPHTRRGSPAQNQQSCASGEQCCDPVEQHSPLTADPAESRPPTDLGPGNEGKEWARRSSETEMESQGNRQPERRGVQSPGGPTASVDEDDLPDWLRIKSEAADPRLASPNRR
jgi:hypothetical protein